MKTGARRQSTQSKTAKIFYVVTLNYHDNLKLVFKRSLLLPKAGMESFFLWGPAAASKSCRLDTLIDTEFVAKV
jgi:hypothetical protein